MILVILTSTDTQRSAKELPQEVKDGLEIIHVRYVHNSKLPIDENNKLTLNSHVWEAMRHVWPEANWPGEHPFGGIESRL